MFVFVPILVLLTIFLPSLALGQALNPDDTELPVWARIVIMLVCTFGAYVLNVIKGYFSKAMDLAAQKTKLAFMAQVDDVVMMKVGELWQTEVKALKAAAADGKLTAAEKEDLKNRAREWAKSLLDAQLLISLFGNMSSADLAIDAMVERQVVKLKLAGKSVKSPWDKPAPSKP